MICDVFRAPAFLAISRPLRNTMTSGNPANIEAASHTLIFFGIKLGKTNVGRYFLHIGKHRRHHLARPTPGCSKSTTRGHLIMSQMFVKLGLIKIKRHVGNSSALRRPLLGFLPSLLLGIGFPDRQSKQLGPSSSFSNSACREVLWKSQRKVPTFHKAHHAH